MKIPDFTQTSTPALWNPNAAVNWSVLFTPAFGAFLHMRNAESLGRTGEAKANRVWFWISIVFTLFGLISVFIPSIPDGVFGWVGFGILAIWYERVARKQAKYVKQTYGKNYQRKSWKKPLLIAFGFFVVFVIAEGILSSVLEAKNPTTEIQNYLNSGNEN